MARPHLLPEMDAPLNRFQGEGDKQEVKRQETGWDKPSPKQEKTPGQRGTKGDPRTEGAGNHAVHDAKGNSPAAAEKGHGQTRTTSYQAGDDANFTRQDQGKSATPSWTRHPGPKAPGRPAGSPGFKA